MLQAQAQRWATGEGTRNPLMMRSISPRSSKSGESSVGHSIVSVVAISSVDSGLNNTRRTTVWSISMRLTTSWMPFSVLNQVQRAHDLHAAFLELSIPPVVCFHQLEQLVRIGTAEVVDLSSALEQVEAALRRRGDHQPLALAAGRLPEAAPLVVDKGEQNPLDGDHAALPLPPERRGRTIRRLEWSGGDKRQEEEKQSERLRNRHGSRCEQPLCLRRTVKFCFRAPVRVADLKPARQNRM